MKKIKIKNIEKLLEITAGNVHTIIINNPEIYRNVIFGLLQNINEYCIYSENSTILDSAKRSILILDLFNLNINDKKIITNLYKKVQTNMSSEEFELLNEINGKVLSFLETISYNFNIEMSYDHDMNVSRLLSIYNYEFKQDYDNYLNYLINYIKSYLEIKEFDFIISVNLINSLKQEELETFKKELEYLNISLIDICNTNYNDKIKYCIIDNDLCEI